MGADLRRALALREQVVNRPSVGVACQSEDNCETQFETSLCASRACLRGMMEEQLWTSRNLAESMRKDISRAEFELQRELGAQDELRQSLIRDMARLSA